MKYIELVLLALLLSSVPALAEGPRPIPVYLFGTASNAGVSVVENEGADEARDHLAVRETGTSIAGFNEPPCESAFFDRTEGEYEQFGGPYEGPDF